MQRLLAETQQQWKADVDELREAKAKDLQESVHNEQQLQETNIQLTAEVSRLQALTKDLREGFTKTRDLLRLEQASLEAEKSKTVVLEEQIESLQREIKRYQLSEEKAAELSKQQIDALVVSMEELEARKVREIQHLREDLSKQFTEQSLLQQEVLYVKGLMEAERMKGTRYNGAGRIGEALVRWRRGRLFTMFRQWSATCVLMSAAEQFRETLNRSVKRAVDEARTEASNTLVSVRATMKTDSEVSLLTMFV